MRGMGEFLVREGVWEGNPIRWMRGPKVTPYSRLPKRLRIPVMPGRLRALFGLQIAFLAIMYGVDLDDDLASIVPPELAGLVDDGPERRPRLRRR